MTDEFSGLERFSDDQLNQELARRRTALYVKALERRRKEHRAVEIRSEECLALVPEHLSSECSDDGFHDFARCTRCAILEITGDGLDLDYTVRFQVEFDPLPRQQD